MDNLLIITIIVALFFDFTNGFHDSANAIATSISTKALRPKVAVAMAAVLNFVGAFLSIKVATTIAQGIVSTSTITLPIIFAGVVSAVIWNLFTWRIGMPTSSSHALVGGLAGATIAGVGTGAVHWHGITDKVLLPSLIAPILGVGISALVVLAIILFTKKLKINISDKIFKRLQIVSAGFVAFTHGANDAQKTMGIIALALIAVHPTQQFVLPTWVIVLSASAMALGTYTGGWRIINTLGKKIVTIGPREGFAAEATTSTLLWVTAHMGFPVSTTHTISSAILGAGSVSQRHSVNKNIIKQILIAWVFTLPCALIVGIIICLVAELPGGLYIIFAGLVTVSWTVFWTQNWDRKAWRQFRVYLRAIE